MLTQGYFYNLDSTEISDSEVSQLSHQQKCLIDKEYLEWLDGESIVAPHKKGGNRRLRCREARLDKAADPAAASGKKACRRTQYARVQKLFRKNCSAGAKQVLSGDWVKGMITSIPLDDQVFFWRRVFGEESQRDNRNPPSTGLNPLRSNPYNYPARAVPFARHRREPLW